MTLALAVAAGFVAALVAPMLSRQLAGAFGWLIAVVPVGLCLYFASLLPQAARGQPIAVTYTWVPTLSIQLSFHADGLALLFALLISGIGALVLIYASGYLAGHPDLGRFYGFLVLFMASMLGLVLAGNVLTLFVFWELTSISSYLLIGFDHEREDGRAAAFQALLVTGGGGLGLLAGLVLLGQIGGSYEVATLLTQGEAVRAHPLYIPTLLLVLVGAFTKSAQMPFHFWLPGAMVAPTPVSACLHSATNVAARRQTRLLQSGYLRFYVMTIIVTTTALVAYAYTSRGTFPDLPPISGVGVTELVLAALIVLGAFITARAPSRLSSVAALSVVGYGVALTYILYGAPDLAMTQFMTETLTVILFVLVFYHLPRFTLLSSVRARWRDGVIAAAAGTLMTVLVLAATALPLDSGLREFYARNSRPLAHGRNVVNVILVDFRARDTLGEITVLGVAAIGVLVLLKLRPPKEHR